MPFCQVIVDINHTDVDHVFTYRVPKGLCVCPGMRIHVPFGPRKLEGVVVEMTEECDLPPERVEGCLRHLGGLSRRAAAAARRWPEIFNGRRSARWRWRSG